MNHSSFSVQIRRLVIISTDVKRDQCLDSYEYDMIKNMVLMLSRGRSEEPADHNVKAIVLCMPENPLPLSTTYLENPSAQIDRPSSQRTHTSRRQILLSSSDPFVLIVNTSRDDAITGVHERHLNRTSDGATV